MLKFVIANKTNTITFTTIIYIVWLFKVFKYKINILFYTKATKFKIT